MSELTLQVISVDTNPPDGLMRRTFGVNGGSIGRDESNFFMLPDQHRRVSRLHATVSFPGGVATITNASSSLTVEVGDVQLERGDSVPLLNGALVEIGPYMLRAIFDADNVIASAPSHVNDLVESSIAASGLAREPAIQNVSLVRGSPLPPPVIASTTLPDDFDLNLPAANSASLPAVDTRNVPLPNNTQYSPPGDPFANLLDGIGSPSSPVLSLANPSPVATSGVSVDPLQSFAVGVEGIGYRAVSPMSPLSDTTTLDPFAMPSGVSRNSADPLAILLGKTTSSDESHAGLQAVVSIDSLFHANSGSTSDSFGLNVGSVNSVDMGSQSSALGGLISVSETADPLALFGASATQSPLQSPMRDDSQEVISSFTPPLPIAPSPHDRTPVVRSDVVNANSLVAQQQTPANVLATPIAPNATTNQSAAAQPATPDSLTAAFLQGAGLPVSALPLGLTPEVMNMVGSILRSATGGAIDMLSARAATKREVQASVTIISVQANNPLKFMPNVDAALTQLLGKKMPGFMRADVAMRDAFDDLRAHEVGVIAGTRAALTEVLGKFDPTVLGDKLARGSVLESLMPSARKAKLWDKYLERYVQIRSEAEDDFQSIFGRAFVQAYESETARIKSQSTPTTPLER